MFSPLPTLKSLYVTQLHGSMRGGSAERYTVFHNGLPYVCLGHAGVDFNAEVGTPVAAMKSGVLSVSPNDPWRGGYAGALGVYAVITLPTGETHLYAHLKSVDVPPGEVLATTIFARSGATGNVTGPHLHIAVRPPRPDYANHFDGTVDFLDHFNHDVQLDLSGV